MGAIFLTIKEEFPQNWSPWKGGVGKRV